MRNTALTPTELPPKHKVHFEYQSEGDQPPSDMDTGTMFKSFEFHSARPKSFRSSASFPVVAKANAHSNIILNTIRNPNQRRCQKANRTTTLSACLSLYKQEETTGEANILTCFHFEEVAVVNVPLFCSFTDRI